MSEMIAKLNSDHVKLKDCEYVQDLVRCEECDYAKDCEQMVIFENGKHITAGYKIYFCSYGVRKERE